MSAVTTSRFQLARSESAAPAVCYVFGEAGSGAAAWRATAAELGPYVDVRAARLAGRENRFHETPSAEVVGQVDDVIGDLVALIRSDVRPYALVGVCAGAITAYETARRLQARAGLAQPSVLVAVDQVAPTAITEVVEPVHAYGAVEFRAWCLANLPERPELNRPEVYDFFLPLLRADFSAIATYLHEDLPQLACPVDALQTKSFDADSKHSPADWAEVTSSRFAFVNAASDTRADAVGMYLKDMAGRLAAR
jgi:surfactin synthase thioesterase subunit